MRIIKMIKYLINARVLLQALFLNIVFSFSLINGQNLEDIIISLDVEEITLFSTLKKIEEKTEYKFVFTENEIPLNCSTTLHVNNISLSKILKGLAIQHNLIFKRINNQIAIKRAVKNKADNRKGKTKGIVLDANSGEPLIGANVIISRTSIGVATNINGEFVLASVKPGNYSLKISYMGFKEKIINVTVVANRTTEIIVELEWVAVEGDEVVVSVQAKGQLSAINEQLSANEIKNVVSKDRIRELPDNNAAEAVGRLPGVSLLRSGGEGHKVVIRGLQPKYSKIMVDGVSLAPNESNDRSVSMSMISSYALEGIEVIKSPTADMDGDQVGGSVNFLMRTAPKGFNYGIIAQGGFNGLRESVSDYSLVGDISNRFLNNKFGVFAQITSDRKNMSSNSMISGYKNDAQKTDVINILRILGVDLTNNFSVRNRYGATLTLDYLIPDGKIYFKNFISSGETHSQIYNERYWERSHSLTTRDVTYKQLIYTNILNYEQYISIFKLKAKLSNSFSGNDKPNDISFSFNKTPDINNFPNDIDPQEIPQYAQNEYDKFLWTSISDAESSTKGRQIMAKLDLETDFSLSNQISGKIKFGGKLLYDERSYDNEKFGGFPYVSSGSEIKDSLISQIPQFSHLPKNTYFFYYPLFYDNSFLHGNFLNGRYDLGPIANIDMMHSIVDIMGRARSTYIYGGALQESDTYLYYHKSSIIHDYTGIERLNAGYVLAEIDITNKIKFIPGIRYEAKETIYNGVVGHTFTLPEHKYKHEDTTSIRNNEFWLPMIHLRIEPLDWLQLRLAYTQTVARPSYRRILPNMDIATTSLTINNPVLRPELSENFDVYLAFSENHLGLVTIGGFLKNIKDKIFSQGKRILTNPAEYNLEPKYKGIIFSTYENNSKLSIVKGIEIDWQTNFWYLPSFLKGFVLNINYTRIFSEAWYPRTIIKRIDNPNKPPRKISINVDESYIDRMQNQPKHILNIGLGYDYKDFSMRLSMNYSPDIFVSGSFYPGERVIVDDYLRWDLSVTQKLPLYGLQLFCNVANLNSTEENSIKYSGSRPVASQYYGTTIYVGVKLNTN